MVSACGVDIGCESEQEEAGDGNKVDLDGPGWLSDTDWVRGKGADSANCDVGVWLLLPKRDICLEAVVFFTKKSNSLNRVDLKTASLKCVGRKPRGSQGRFLRVVVFPAKKPVLGLVIVSNCCW